MANSTGCLLTHLRDAIHAFVQAQGDPWWMIMFTCSFTTNSNMQESLCVREDLVPESFFEDNDSIWEMGSGSEVNGIEDIRARKHHISKAA